MPSAMNVRDGRSIRLKLDRIAEMALLKVTMSRLLWPDRHFVPDAVIDYCMFVVPSSAGDGRRRAVSEGGMWPSRVVVNPALADHSAQ